MSPSVAPARRSGSIARRNARSRAAVRTRSVSPPILSSLPDRKLAAPLQYDQAACLTRLQATSTRGVRARLHRVAGCATSTGFAGHAGATANLKLTFHPDHSVGANQPTEIALAIDPLAPFNRGWV